MSWVSEKVPQLLGKNIIIVTPELKSFKVRAGGLGPAVEELATALAKLGLRVFIVSLLYKFNLQDGKVEVDYSDIPMESTGKRVKVRVGGQEVEAEVKKSQVGKAVVYFLDNGEYTELLYGGDMLKQAIFLGRGTLELLKALELKPHILHLHDGNTGLVAFYLKSDPKYSEDPFFGEAKVVFTVHNAGKGYQQEFSVERFPDLEVEKIYFDTVVWKGKVNLMYAALRCCDRCNTVSEDYAIALKMDGEELREVFLEKDIFGITNGIDVDYWKVEELKKPKLSLEELKLIKSEGKQRLLEEIRQRTGKTLKREKLLVVMPRRLAGQKGFDVIFPYVYEMCKARSAGGLGVQFIMLGYAHPKDLLGQEWEERFKKLHQELEGFVFIHGFDEELAKLMYFGGDLILYPSLPNLEPCGTGYMMAAINATPSLVTNTGGVIGLIYEFDPILEKGNGFLVWKEVYSPLAFFDELKKAAYIYYEQPEKWMKLLHNTLQMEVGMEKVAQEYALKLYAAVA